MESRLLTEAVNEVLFELWDPIGAKSIDIDWPMDEYEHYVGAIVALVRQGAAVGTIAEHLERLETEQMGLTPSVLEVRLDVASKVRATVLEFDGGKEPAP